MSDELVFDEIKPKSKRVSKKVTAKAIAKKKIIKTKSGNIDVQNLDSIAEDLNQDMDDVISEAAALNELATEEDDFGSGPRTEREILKEITFPEDHTLVLRKWVELTPAMCDSPGCGFDALRILGLRLEKNLNWKNINPKQKLANGETLGEYLSKLVEKHKQAVHFKVAKETHIRFKGSNTKYENDGKVIVEL